MKEVDPYFQNGLEDLIQLCQELAIEELYFFGSAIDGRFMPGQSDLDVLVKTALSDISHIVPLSVGLRKIYGTPVDVFHSAWPLHPELAAYLLHNKVKVYPPKVKLAETTAPAVE